MDGRWHLSAHAYYAPVRIVRTVLVEVSNVEIDVDDDVPVRTTCTYSSTRYTVAVGVRNNLLH